MSCHQSCSSCNRPLPDERPRQSVANLIGRFETQNKRLSISASSPSRSSSVVSHVTGDSAKEEVKDKREWPPKSVTSAEKPPLVILSSLRYVPPSQGSQSLSDPSPSTPSQVKQEESLSQTRLDAPLTTTALEKQTTEAPDSFLENWRKDISLVPAEMAPELDPTPPELIIGVPTPSLPTPTAASMQKFGNTASPRTPTAASTKFASKAAVSKVPTKGTTTKSPGPKQSLTTQPLRPQHTGQSVASTTSTRKSTVKPAPVTPQSKSGPRSDASRAKTPTSSRSKTPSTGLFAPTAASLARSRNAPPQVPTSTKKSTLSSSSMDRLSKPTAASLSKARLPANAVSTSTSRLTAAKTKAAPTTPKDKSIAQKPAAQIVAAPDQNGSGAIPAAMDDNVIEAEAPPVPDTTEEVVLIDEGAISEDADPTIVFSSPAAPEEEAVVEEPHKNFTSSVSASELVANHSEEHKPTDDLEDIVNLLESAPLAKSEPATIPDMPDMPDDILEIPDEDEKHQ